MVVREVLADKRRDDAMEPDIPYPIFGPRQKCRICGMPLTTYNTTGECFHHLPPEKNTTNWLLGIMQEVLVEFQKSSVELK